MGSAFAWSAWSDLNIRLSFCRLALVPKLVLLGALRNLLRPADGFGASELNSPEALGSFGCGLKGIEER